nr:hypothetical protein [Kibdelosporangium sp. MJ126-NF4]
MCGKVDHLVEQRRNVVMSAISTSRPLYLELSRHATEDNLEVSR